MLSVKSFYYRLCVATCFCVILGGCAFSKTTVPLDFKPDASGEKVDVSTLIRVEKLKDIRGTDPYVLANKGVTYKTSGTYVAEKEIADAALRFHK